MECKSRILTTHWSGERRPYRRVLGAKTLIGDTAWSFDGDYLGKIKEVMIDLQSGRVAYVVLSIGGLLGIGEKLFAVPWDSLLIDEGNKQFVVDATLRQLENVPGFAKDKWPDAADPDWRAQIHGYYHRP
jgi:sporulation protein YlmC with PRC-barrel domain